MLRSSCEKHSSFAALCVFVSLLLPSGGCSKPQESGGGGQSAADTASPVVVPKETAPPEPLRKATADPNDVKAARAIISGLGSRSKCEPKEGDLLTAIVIQEGSNVKAEDLSWFGKLSDLDRLQIFNCRTLNDEMASTLSGLKDLKSLALTNSAITDATVEMIAKSFPELTELDLSSNTNMTNKVVRILGGLSKLQRLTLVQDRLDDIGAQRLSKLKELQALDLRGNMEAGNMALEVVAELPKLTAFKHRSTAVTDSGMDALSKNETLESLLVQDFVITNESGPYLAKLGKLAQLEVFRCPGFGSDGVLALKGTGLTRLTLRDLPNIDDHGMEVFDELPKLRRLFLHELPSVSDVGLKHLSNLNSLEQFDVWAVPQMKDSTVDVLSKLPNLKELSIRATGVTDACVDVLLKIPSLKSLTFKENGSVTPAGLKKLSAKKWAKLDIGAAGADSSETVAP